MKILLSYIKPYKWLVVFTLFLAAVNQVFSLFSPLIIGKILNQFAISPHDFLINNQPVHRTEHEFFFGRGTNPNLFDYFFGKNVLHGLLFYLSLMVGTAMVSRIAKAFQDYFSNVLIQKFGATIFTDGLKHSMSLPYQDFEDQRSGETLSVLTKVRADTEKFITSFISIFFMIIVSVVFISVVAFSIHWAIMPVYAGGILLIAVVTSFLSRKIKSIKIGR